MHGLKSDLVTRLSFNLMDALVLVAAVAAGMVEFRHMHPLLEWKPTNHGDVLTNSLRLSIAFLLPLTLAFFGWRLVHLPPRHELIDRPGTVALLTASITLGIHLALWLIVQAIRDRPSASDFPATMLDIAPFSVGYAILPTWIMLAFAGRWRPVEGLIDRGGLLVGFGWASVSLIATARNNFQ